MHVQACGRQRREHARRCAVRIGAAHGHDHPGDWPRLGQPAAGGGTMREPGVAQDGMVRTQHQPTAVRDARLVVGGQPAGRRIDQNRAVMRAIRQIVEDDDRGPLLARLALDPRIESVMIDDRERRTCDLEPAVGPGRVDLEAARCDRRHRFQRLGPDSKAARPARPAQRVRKGNATHHVADPEARRGIAAKQRTHHCFSNSHQVRLSRPVTRFQAKP